jgi:hypothetical protein
MFYLIGFLGFRFIGVFGVSFVFGLLAMKETLPPENPRPVGLVALPRLLEKVSPKY